jgi:hypothetical protein
VRRPARQRRWIWRAWEKHGVYFAEAQRLWQDTRRVEIPAWVGAEPRWRRDAPNLKARRVNVDFPAWVVDGLDQEAQRLGITRQSLIKMWIAERLEGGSHGAA